MSGKTKLLAAAGSLIAALGSSVVIHGAAQAATPSCGNGCVDVFSQQFGTEHHPAFLIDSYKQGTATGTPLILFQESNSDPAEDFTPTFQGTVASFLAASLVSSAVALHYGCTHPIPFPTCANAVDLPAFEMQYSPYGAPTGECAGVAATPVAGTKVSLQPCGVSGRTVWITDFLDGVTSPFHFGRGIPLINGADTNFSQPFVLTYPSGGNPVDKPRPQLYVSNLTGFSNGIVTETETINSDMLWDAVQGPIT